MKKRTHNRYLSMALALLMLLPLVTVPTFAADQTETSLWSEDFSSYSDKLGQAATIGTSPMSTATYEADPTDASNTVLKVPMTPKVNNTEVLLRMNGSVPVENGYYTVTRNAETNAVEVAGWTVTANADGTYNITNGTNTYSNLVLGKMSDYYGYYAGDGAYNQQWRINHPAVSYETQEKIVIGFDYYLSSDAFGIMQAQIYNLYSDGVKKSFIEIYRIYPHDGTIGLMGGWPRYAVLNKEEWNRVEIQLDLVTGDMVLCVNGAKVQTADLGYRNISFDASQWIFSKIPRKQSDYQKYAGYVLFDNMAFSSTFTPVTYHEGLSSYSDQLGQPVTLGSNYMSTATYEADPDDASNTVLKVPMTPKVNNTEVLLRMNGSGPVENGYYTVNRNAATNAVEVAGWTVTANADGTYNITDGTNTYSNLVLGKMSDYYGYYAGDGAYNQQWIWDTPAISYEIQEQVVFGFDYYLSTDAYGLMQGQIYKYYSAEKPSGVGFGALYTINTATGKIGLMNSASAALSKGKWNRVEIQLNLVTGDMVLYVNGAKVQTASFGHTNIYFNASQWIVSKIPRKQSDYKSYAGYALLDNVEFLPTFTPVTYREGFSSGSNKHGETAVIGAEYNTAATFEADPFHSSNTAVKIPFAEKANDAEALIQIVNGIPTEGILYPITRNTVTGAVEVAGWTVTANADGTYDMTDGSTEYTGLTLSKTSVYYTYYRGDGTTDQNWRLDHPAASYTDTQQVVFAYDLYLSKNAFGRIIGQLKTYQSGSNTKYWGTLYVYDASTGKIAITYGKVTSDSTPASLIRGEWNRVECQLNLESGAMALYVNGTKVDEGNIGATNITVLASSWNFAKLPAKMGNYKSYAGYLMVDNLSMSGNVSDRKPISVNSENLLYVQANGKKVYSNPFYFTAGTTYEAVYFQPENYADLLATINKNSIRLSAEAGLRFATAVDLADLDELFALLDGGDIKELSFGHLIAPADYVAEAGELSREAFDAASLPYLNVLATRDRYYDIDKDPATTHFVGSIVNLYEHNITRDFVGRGYVTLTLHSGQTINLYAPQGHTDNVQAVAIDALKLDINYTQNQLDILNTFAAGKAPAVSESGKADRALQGLNVLAIGDSIFDGHRLSGDKTWLGMSAQKYHWNFTNLAWDGWTVAKNDGAYATGVNIRGSMYDNLVNNTAYVYGGTQASYTYGNPAGVAPEDVDLILLEGGTNDKQVGIPLGDINSATDLASGDNYLGALNQMILILKELYPNAKIALVTAWHGLDYSTYTVDGMKALKNTVYADDENVVIVDAGNPELNGGVDMADPAFRAEYANSANDVNHLNEKGMKIMLQNMPALLYNTLFAEEK